ncbi:MAG: hypothetical protein K6E62_02380, partial [Lachnospiraceae bacterium]|nr:hypothetical protein [Lachnospiraceae bacterium]
QTFLVDEHHVHVYASKKNDGTIVKADRPPDVFRNSLATPSLLAVDSIIKVPTFIGENSPLCYAM